MIYSICFACPFRILNLHIFEFKCVICMQVLMMMMMCVRVICGMSISTTPHYSTYYSLCHKPLKQNQPFHVTPRASISCMVSSHTKYNTKPTQLLLCPAIIQCEDSISTKVIWKIYLYKCKSKLSVKNDLA